MYAMVAETAARYPRHTAHIFMGRRTSYRAFLRRVDAAARGLLALGIGRGDRLTICMPNTPQALECFYALNRIGAVASMIHPLSAPEEIAFYLKISSSKAVLTLDSFYPKVASAVDTLQQPVRLLVAAASDALPFPVSFLRPSARLPKGGYTRWTKVLSFSSAALPEAAGSAADCAAILYSGGTTGTPKGICLSNRNFNALALQTIAASGCCSIAGMKMLSILPIFHGFGLGIGIHTALAGGAACILVPRFSVKTYAKILKKQKPHFIPGVPALFEAFLRAESLKDADLSFLRGIFCGGDTLSPSLKKQVDDFLRAHNCNAQIREGYGATECVTASCLTPEGCHKSGSVGIPFPDTFYKIVRTGTVEEADPLTDGEICISGPTVMTGYLDNAAETARTLRRHADGKLWLHTGDLGYMDCDGFVYFRQRIKRMIIKNGYNIYPAQLENILCAHEKIRLACVIGIPDPRQGQRVKAYLVPVAGIQPDEKLKAEILRYCESRIARYALPQEIEFRTALPTTPVGKVAYRTLEEEAQRLES